MANILDHVRLQVQEIRDDGLHKAEREIMSPQDADIRVADNSHVLNLCANNYLGLANHPDVVKAARDALTRWGYGMASVRFICGTQTIHHQLEAALSDFLGTDDTILYGSCFDANGGLFETLLSAEDAIISDQLNHASIIDGVRLCKAQRFRYRNNDMTDLKAQLEQAQSARSRLIATDGVFSMDGYLADLPSICELADRYDASIMVDDSHAVGFIGPNGRALRNILVWLTVSTSSPELWARLWAAPAVATLRLASPLLICCVSDRDRICFPTRLRRRLPPQHSEHWNCCRKPMICDVVFVKTRRGFERPYQRLVSTFFPEIIPSFRL